jgi:pyruvate formate lyase activating enzyme
MNISGFQKFSLIDYPGKISAVVFTQGCNFRCPYCHNPELFENKPGLIDEKIVLDFLKTRKNQLETVVITGGEPTLQPDLINFLEKVNKLGFLAKLDTNGTKPQIIQKALKLNLVDYIAMDIKGPINKYSEIVGVKVDTKNILKSIRLIRQKAPDYEFRTTVTREQLAKNDIEKIGEMIKGSKQYSLQKYVSRFDDKAIKGQFSPYNDKSMIEFQKIMSSYTDCCFIK